MTTLVLVAHADDETLGCGATIARLTAAGQRVCVAVLGDGVTARYVDLPDRDAVHAEIDARWRMFVAACACLGAEAKAPAEWLPDNRFDTLPRLTLARAVEGVIAQVRPDQIYTHHAGDLNVDHRRVAEAVLTATRPGGAYAVREVYAFEVPSSTEWVFGAIEPRFSPNVFVNVTSTLARKLEAMSFYDTEVRPSPHPRSIEMLKARAAYWGAMAGFAAAEPLQLIRSLRDEL